jgi:hypothetical protein
VIFFFNEHTFNNKICLIPVHVHVFTFESCFVSPISNREKNEKPVSPSENKKSRPWQLPTQALYKNIAIRDE